MDRFEITGGIRLTGEVPISGAKNAAVAIIPATVLSDGICRIENVPEITDVSLMIEALQEMGAVVRYLDRNTVEIDPRPIQTCRAPFSEGKRNIRGSYYFLGALLGRCGHGIVAMPGGCNLGVRPIDQHLKGFAALGATHRLEEDIVEVQAEKLRGNDVYLDVVSVGATMNIMLAAVKAEGITVIENAAREPHIVDLANFLNSMGADVRGAGTDVIKIRGQKHLGDVTYSIIPDQIEAGTYMVAAAATEGDVLIRNVIPKHLESITTKLEEMGVSVQEGDDCVRVSRLGKMRKCNIKTMPHPGFPTDMNPQIAVLLSLAEGTSRINESIWEDRFRYVSELEKMGVDMRVNGTTAIVNGVGALKPAVLRATDLRAGAAMVIAALCAQGVSYVEELRYIDRGYENMEEKLRALGANIRRVPMPETSEKR